MSVTKIYEVSEHAVRPKTRVKKDNMITNEYIIRNVWTTEELADALIKHDEEVDWDYDVDDEIRIFGSHDLYTTSDDETFYDYEEALKHEIKWLRKERQQL